MSRRVIALLLIFLMMGTGMAYTETKTFGPLSCPTNTDRDVCKAFYDLSFDRLAGYVKIGVHSHPYKLPEFGGRPPYNVTARTAIIDGLNGVIMNVSRFSNVDDAIHAEKALDPTFPWNFTLDQVKDDWTRFGSLDGEMVQMYAHYNLSDRKNGASGWVLISGEIDQWTSPADVMHVINTIHVTETRSYAKYTGEKPLPPPTIPTYDTTYTVV